VSTENVMVVTKNSSHNPKNYLTPWGSLDGGGSFYPETLVLIRTFSQLRILYKELPLKFCYQHPIELTGIIKILKVRYFIEEEL
jgi:hypothetical protein